MRLLIRQGQSAATAQAVLSEAAGDARHEFWPDEAGYADVPIQGIISHRQVTDAYLAQLARARGSRLATFDQAMAKLHNDVADPDPGQLTVPVLPADARPKASSRRSSPIMPKR